MSEEQNKNTTQDQVNGDATTANTGDVAEETPTTTEEVVEEAIEPTKSAKEEKTVPEFRAGDTVRISYKIIEGDKTRLQPFEGIVISKRGEGMSKTFTVRKIGADNVGVERIFPLYSPNIESIKVMKRGKVRRAKLYYLRDKKGKEAKNVKELK